MHSTEQHLPPVPMHSRSLCLPALLHKMQGVIYEARCETFGTIAHYIRMLTSLCMCVCVSAVESLQSFGVFHTAACTYYLSFSPLPHPPVWPTPPPSQSFTQQPVFPGQFPIMVFDSFSVDQRQGVYVCVFLWVRYGCVMSLRW